MSAPSTIDGPDAAQRAAWARDGYLVARGFLGPAEMARILAWTEALQHAPEQRGRHWVYHEASLV